MQMNVYKEKLDRRQPMHLAVKFWPTKDAANMESMDKREKTPSHWAAQLDHNIFDFFFERKNPDVA